MVTSGPRCRDYNLKAGGVPDSEHTVPTGCEAADLVVGGSRERWGLVNAAIQAGITRLGIGHSFLHVGVSTAHDPQCIWVYDTGRT